MSPQEEIRLLKQCNRKLKQRIKALESVLRTTTKALHRKIEKAEAPTLSRLDDNIGPLSHWNEDTEDDNIGPFSHLKED